MAAQQPLFAVSPEAIEKLKYYDFPGNVRELRNLIERASILSSGSELGAESFPVPLSSGEAQKSQGSVGAISTSLFATLPEVTDLRHFLAEAEKALILRTLKSTNGAQAEAALRPGISRSDLGYKIAKHGISDREG